jgi:hypothetical protein
MVNHAAAESLEASENLRDGIGLVVGVRLDVDGTAIDS